MPRETTSVCQECGASIYKEHLDSGIARYEDGKLLCAHCVAEFEQAHDGAAADDQIEPISFEDDDDEVDMSQSRIQVMSAGSMLASAGKWDESRYQRALDPQHAGATRCRTFHSKLNEGAIEFMNNAVNEWLESDKNIVMKFATSTIGIFEGKHPEPNLILTVFY